MNVLIPVESVFLQVLNEIVENVRKGDFFLKGNVNL